MLSGQTRDLMICDNNGRLCLPHGARPFSLVNQSLLLQSNVVATVVVPQLPNSPPLYTAYFDYNKSNYGIWVLPAATPILVRPTATATLTLAQLNPEGRSVAPGQTLQFLFVNYDDPSSEGYYIPLAIEYYANTQNGTGL